MRTIQTPNASFQRTSTSPTLYSEGKPALKAWGGSKRTFGKSERAVAMRPEAVAAARILHDEGVAANVLCLTSPGRLYRELKEARRHHLLRGTSAGDTGHLDELIPPGGFASVRYSEKSMLITGAGQGQATGVALRQGTNVYIATVAYTPERAWTAKSTDAGQVTAAEFNLLQGPGPGTPDLSAPFQIGFFRANSGPAPSPGGVQVNGPTYGFEPHVPFGGQRDSGTGWREPGTEALDVYSDWKTVYVTHDPASV